MSSFLIHQIIYKEEQRKHLYDFTIPYFNTDTTETLMWFENKLICDLVLRTEADYIGVTSWRLKEKRMDGWTPVLLKFDHNGDNLSLEKFQREEADVYNLCPRSETHKMLTMSAHWHGGPQHNYAWDNAIKELKKFIPIPEEVKTPIYENCQVVRKELYYSYINDCLKPCIDFMRGRDVFFVDSGYAEKKARKQPEEVERYRKISGKNDWPIAPFILERLFSIWIDSQDLKILNV